MAPASRCSEPASARATPQDKTAHARWRPALSRSNQGGVTKPPPRIVIIGAGFGGLEAARALAHASADVVVLDARNHHTFQPLLYQVATAALSPAEIAWPIRHLLKGQ